MFHGTYDLNELVTTGGHYNSIQDSLKITSNPISGLSIGLSIGG
jgi:hypothetical protein